MKKKNNFKTEWKSFVESFRSLKKNRAPFMLIGLLDIAHYVLFFLLGIIFNIIFLFLGSQMQAKTALLQNILEYSATDPSLASKYAADFAGIKPIFTSFIVLAVLFVLLLIYNWSLFRIWIWKTAAFASENPVFKKLKGAEAQKLKRNCLSGFFNGAARGSLRQSLSLFLFNMAWIAMIILLLMVPALKFLISSGESGAPSVGGITMMMIYFALAALLIVHIKSIIHLAFGCVSASKNPDKAPGIFRIAVYSIKLGIKKFPKFIIPYLFIGAVFIAVNLVLLLFRNIIPPVAYFIVLLAAAAAFLAWARLYFAKIALKIAND